MSDERRTQKHRRADYELVLSTIRANVGDPQPPLVESRPLWTTLVANGGLEHEFAQSALRAAVENGDVVKWRDGNGNVQYALDDGGLETVTGSNPYGPEDADALRQCLETEAERDDTDKAFIGWCNRRLSEVRE